MTVQVNLQNTNVPFIVGENSKSKSGTIVQNGSRTTVLKQFTVMAKVTASGKWTPYVSASLTTGASVPSGIYLGDDILAATLVAGDVLDCPILVAGVVDKNQVIFDDGTLSFTTVFLAIASAFLALTAEDFLRLVGIFCEDSIDITAFEN